MKILNPNFIFPLILIIFFSYSQVNVLASNIDNFLKCLPSHSNQSNPISNAIYTNENPSFLTILQNYIRESRFNTSSTPKPLAIITALDVSHIQATILCAKSNGLQIRIRSGGHDYEGLSYVSNVPFIILDMFNFRSIEIDIENEHAWVQAGATLGELYYNIAKNSKVHAFPAGVCFTVGAGGHFSGGGYGNLQREFGLSVDNIIDAIIIDVNGRVLDRKSMGEDLFWAIRGGGAASFCVVLSWKIKLVRVPETVTVFNVPRSLEQGATDVVLQWQRVASKIDRKLFIRVQPQLIEDEGKKTIEVSFIGLYLGRADALVSLVNKSFPLLGLKSKDCKEMAWIETTLFWNGNSDGTPIEVLLDRTPSPSYSFTKKKSDYFDKVIPREGLEKIWKKIINLKLKNATFSFQWNPYGGRISEISDKATPFPHRSKNLFLMQYIMTWKDDSPKVTQINIEATRQLYETFTPFVTKHPREAFLNYRDIDIGTNANGSLVFAYEFFKGNVPRLLHVKAKVDPTNFFTNEQSIPILPKKP
ncbi:unnamed protein product [Amaranthus hypochondriacus]